MSRWPGTFPLRRPTNPLALTAVGVALAAHGCAAGTEGQPGRQAFVERLGNDTSAVEVWTRGENIIEGDLLVRVPVTRVGHYSATLASDGTVERLEAAWRTPAENPDGPPPDSFTVLIHGDSAKIEVHAGREPGTRTVAVPPGVVPTIAGTRVTFGLYEQAILQSLPRLESVGDSVPIAFLLSQFGAVRDNGVVLVGPDSVSIGYFGIPQAYNLDASGRLRRFSGEGTPAGFVAERVEDAEVAALAAEFAARDVRGAGIGVASPGDTVEATVAGAELQVIYARPAKRGRDIWGGLVPHGEVWRTGANAATHFITDRDLEIGGVALPAGTYTLYSIYNADSAKLIINEQTGQWGTIYDEGRDLARIDMTREELAEPVERFAIGIEPEGEGGALTLAWDRTRYRVPFRVR